MTTTNIQALESCFKEQSIKESFESLYHCLGFITAMASSPDEVPPSEWVEQLVTTEDKRPNFDNEEQVKNLTHNLVGWWNQCNQLFDEGGTIVLPKKLGLTPTIKANKALTEFASGYLRGFDWLTEAWLAALPEDAEEAHRTIMILNFILARFIDEKSMRQEEPDLYKQLPDTEGCFRVLPNLISGVGMLGKDFALNDEDLEHLTIEEFEQQPQQEKIIEPHSNIHKTVGRNDLCPCGSGKKFKKCCLH